MAEDRRGCQRQMKFKGIKIITNNFWCRSFLCILKVTLICFYWEHLLENTVHLCFSDCNGSLGWEVVLWWLPGNFNIASPSLYGFQLGSVNTRINQHRERQEGPREEYVSQWDQFTIQYGHSLPLQPVAAYDGCFRVTKTKKKHIHKYYKCRIQRSWKIRITCFPWETQRVTITYSFIFVTETQKIFSFSISFLSGILHNKIP